MSRLSTGAHGLIAALLFTILMCGGCAIAPSNSSAYYSLVLGIHSDPTPHLLFEKDRVKKVYGGEGTAYFYWIFWPLTPADGNYTGVHLFNYPVQWWDPSAPFILVWGDRHRSLGDIFELAEGVDPVPFWVGRVQQEQAQVRWIIGDDPFIIAVGTDLVPIRVIGRGLTGSGIELGETYSMIREKDLDRTATELIVLDKWPAEWQDTGTEFEEQFTEQLAKVTRIVKLDHPMTLRDIIASKMWQSTPP